MSRTYIPAALTDNPYLARTNYKAQVDALPEPLRSAIRDGDFKAGRIDNPDERIQQDTMSFVSHTISFLLDLLGSVVNFFSFALILWTISRTL